MKNKIEDVRNHLFEQLERLSDDEEMKKPENLERELKRAKAIAEVSSVIVDSAKAETDFVRVTNGTPGTAFFVTTSGPKGITAGGKKDSTQ